MSAVLSFTSDFERLLTPPEPPLRPARAVAEPSERPRTPPKGKSLGQAQAAASIGAAAVLAGVSVVYCAEEVCGASPFLGEMLAGGLDRDRPRDGP